MRNYFYKRVLTRCKACAIITHRQSIANRITTRPPGQRRAGKDSVNKFAAEAWSVCTKPPNDQWYENRTIGVDEDGGRRVCDMSPLMREESRQELGRLICCAPDGYALAQAIVALATGKTGGLSFNSDDLTDMDRALVQKADGHD